MNWKPSASLNYLKMRAALLAEVRIFFQEQNVLEVETPLLCSHTVTDPHLHSFQVNYLKSQHSYYLQTSPEYAMKRLLAAGSGSIYQICKAFRAEEKGKRHNAEFTMLEWYRVGYTHHELMDEVEILLQRLLKINKAERISYKDLFLQNLHINPLTCTIETLSNVTEQYQKEFPRGLDVNDKDTWLQFIMAELLEPLLVNPTFVYNYPPSQGALAKISEDKDNEKVAERFELYYKGIELANGFHELADAKEQAHRFQVDNAYRKKYQLDHIPPDTYLLEALAEGFPQCSGVAMGLDRVIMLALGLDNIQEVLSFDMERV